MKGLNEGQKQPFEIFKTREREENEKEPGPVGVAFGSSVKLMRSRREFERSSNTMQRCPLCIKSSFIRTLD
jgi:hypothetical protein